MNFLGKMLRLRPKTRELLTPISRQMSGYPGGLPGVNLPFSKGFERRVRFTIFWTIYGILGFGSPFLVLRHSMVWGKTPVPLEPKEDGGEE